jgi:hypothetical protein
MQFSVQFRDPGIFDNTDCFQPSRWESPTKEMLDAFIPFSLGKQFSTSRVEYFTSKPPLLFIHRENSENLHTIEKWLFICHTVNSCLVLVTPESLNWKYHTFFL